MRLFLAVFFLIYGSLHLHAFLKAKTALSLSAKTGIPLFVFMAVMTSAPVIVRYLEGLKLEIPARILSYAGYTWMGVLILFFTFAVCIDIYRLALCLIHLALHIDLSAVSLSAKSSFFIALISAVTVSCYGYFEAMDIQTERIYIKSSRIPAESGGLKIVQISDVHAGLIVREARLRRIADKVMAESPDIVVSTGDFVDGQINSLNGFADIFSLISPAYGKYAVTGNHEYYAGLDQALEFTRKAGFTILRGEAVEVAGIYIAGVDDPTGKQFGRISGKPERELLSGLDGEKFKILLKHRPIVNSEGTGHFDLQLSGHTHKG
ncbi:MAG: metallophosphoesterase [Nitrospirota bacterium]